MHLGDEGAVEDRAKGSAAFWQQNGREIVLFFESKDGYGVCGTPCWRGLGDAGWVEVAETRTEDSLRGCAGADHFAGARATTRGHLVWMWYFTACYEANSRVAMGGRMLLAYLRHAALGGNKDVGLVRWFSLAKPRFTTG